MKLNIQDNPYNGGLACYFTHNGQEYYADLCLLPCAEYTECMIFPSEDEHMTSLSELYCKRDIPVTVAQLEQCIEEFIKTIDK